MENCRDVPLIDGHSHCPRPEISDILTGIMDRLDLKAFTICAVCYAGGKSTQANPLALLNKLARPGKVYACGGLFHKLPGRDKGQLDLLGQARGLMSLGFDGIKMLHGKPTAYKDIAMPTNDPVYDDCYTWLQAESVPIIFHVADPEEFWDRRKIPPRFLKMGWCYDDGTYPSKEQLYDEIDDILARFPRLRIIFAHFYFLSADIERAGRFLDRWPAVSFDITPGMEMYGNFSAKRDQWRDFFTRYGDRIVFGTDNVWSVDEGGMDHAVSKIRNMRRFLETDDEFTFGRYTCRGLALDRATIEGIYHANFERYFGPAPKPVNGNDALAYCRRLAELAGQTPGQDEATSALEKIADRLARLSG